MICNQDCENCIHPDCIDDRSPNAVRCARWFERHKDAKRAYQREYARKRRMKKEDCNE